MNTLMEKCPVRFFLLMVFFVKVGCGTVLVCPPKWNQFNEKCYKLSPKEDQVIFSEARKLCQDEDAELVVVNDKEEQQFITNLLTAQLNSLDLNTPLWIGCKRDDDDGMIRWVTGEAWNYSNWRLGEPNNGGINTDTIHEGCANIVLYPPQTFGQWNDVICSLNNNFICEKDSAKNDMFYKTRDEGLFLTESSLIKTFLSYGEIDCALHCLQQEGCISFKYNKEMCSLHRDKPRNCPVKNKHCSPGVTFQVWT